MEGIKEVSALYNEACRYIDLISRCVSGCYINRKDGSMIALHHFRVLFPLEGNVAISFTKYIFNVNQYNRLIQFTPNVSVKEKHEAIEYNKFLELISKVVL